MRPVERVDDAVPACAGDIFRKINVEIGSELLERVLRMPRKDSQAVDVYEPAQTRLGIQREEGVPSPHRKFPQLEIEKSFRHDAAVEDARCSGAIGLVVRHHREVGVDHFGTGCDEVGASRAPQLEHRRPRLDSRSEKVTDARSRALLRVFADVHARYRETYTGERLRLRGSPARRPVFVDERNRPHTLRVGQSHPRLHAPEVSARVGICGH